MRYSHFDIFGFLIVVAVAAAAAGCSSAAYDPKVRRERLLAVYPPGETTRADVQGRWAPTTPNLTVARPVDGWSALDNPRVRERIAASELRTGKPVHLVDCYVGPDARNSFDFFGLCDCWFYFDAENKVVDAEWQYHTD
jgi:hypothetical protein